LTDDWERSGRCGAGEYHDAIADAVADLGKPEDIGKVFAGFQKYLYEEAAA
jgi:hypothetical protein